MIDNFISRQSKWYADHAAKINAVTAKFPLHVLTDDKHAPLRLAIFMDSIAKYLN